MVHFKNLRQFEWKKHPALWLPWTLFLLGTPKALRQKQFVPTVESGVNHFSVVDPVMFPFQLRVDSGAVHHCRCAVFKLHPDNSRRCVFVILHYRGQIPVVVLWMPCPYLPTCTQFIHGNLDSLWAGVAGRTCTANGGKWSFLFRWTPHLLGWWNGGRG